MKLTENRYSRFALVREMLETPGVISNFDQSVAARFAERIKVSAGLLLTGEGSSRIFPAKRAIYDSLKHEKSIRIFTEGSTQAMEYDLSDFSVFGASNSGQTKEVIRLITGLRGNGHKRCFGLTANKDTRLEKITEDTHILSCGKEDAVAATKSVVEQALFYDALGRKLSGESMDSTESLAEWFRQVLEMRIEPEITERISRAGKIYFAGRNDGVAEELTLKTNEITRKKSGFLEGTYAVHGIEEVMDPDEVVIWINPFREEIEKFEECLVKGVGLSIIAISSVPTKFPTVLIPDAGRYGSYLELAAGWNLLVETGLALGIDLDNPLRARKVGNEFNG